MTKMYSEAMSFGLQTRMKIVQRSFIHWLILIVPLCETLQMYFMPIRAENYKEFLISEMPIVLYRNEENEKNTYRTDSNVCVCGRWRDGGMVFKHAKTE